MDWIWFSSFVEVEVVVVVLGKHCLCLCLSGSFAGQLEIFLVSLSGLLSLPFGLAKSFK